MADTELGHGDFYIMFRATELKSLEATGLGILYLIERNDISELFIQVGEM